MKSSRYYRNTLEALVCRARAEGRLMLVYFLEMAILELDEESSSSHEQPPPQTMAA